MVAAVSNAMTTMMMLSTTEITMVRGECARCRRRLDSHPGRLGLLLRLSDHVVVQEEGGRPT